MNTMIATQPKTTTRALCPPKASVGNYVAADRKRHLVEWKPWPSARMQAELIPYGTGWKVTWRIAVKMEKNGRPATGLDATANVFVDVAFDDDGKWVARISPGQDEGERPLVLEGDEGGYPAAQTAVTEALADYVRKIIGKRRGLVPVALSTVTGGNNRLPL